MIKSLKNILQTAAAGANAFTLPGDLMRGKLMLVLAIIGLSIGLLTAGGQSAAAQASAGRAGAGQQTGEQARRPTVAAGAYQSLALKSEGTIVAWGSNDSGEATVPAGLNGVTAIAAGANHSDPRAIQFGLKLNF